MTVPVLLLTALRIVLKTQGALVLANIGITNRSLCPCKTINMVRHGSEVSGVKRFSSKSAIIFNRTDAQLRHPTKLPKLGISTQN